MSSLAYSIPSIVIRTRSSTHTRIIRYPLCASVKCIPETREVNMRPPARIHLRMNGTLVFVFTINLDPSTISSDLSAPNASSKCHISAISCCPSASNVTRYFQFFASAFCLIYSSPVSRAAQAPRLVIWCTQCICSDNIIARRRGCVPSVDPSSTTSISSYPAAMILSITSMIRVASLYALMRNMILFFCIG